MLAIVLVVSVIGIVSSEVIRWVEIYERLLGVE